MKKSVALGLCGNEMSKEITGTSEVSVERSVIATGAGVALGAASTGALVVAGVASSAVTVPVTLISGGVAFLSSLFD